MNKAAQPGRGAVRSTMIRLSVCDHQAAPVPGDHSLRQACLAAPNHPAARPEFSVRSRYQPYHWMSGVPLNHLRTVRTRSFDVAMDTALELAKRAGRFAQ
jgi:hypothetical protein